MVSLSLDPPPSNHRGSSPAFPLRALAVLALVAAALGAGFWLGRATASRGASHLAGAAPAPPAAPAAAAPSAATSTAAASAAPATAPAGVTSIAAGAAAPPPVQPGAHRLSVVVKGPLEESIAAALPGGDRRLAEELTAVVNRLLVWDLQVARDGRRGDRLELLWEPAPAAAPGVPVAAEPVVLALRYASSKLGNTFAAYRFEPKGARFARYYRPDGGEVESRLVDAPVADYEQVTSLLRDGRRHKGIDFKTPVGSPVVATFDGVVERRNWNFAGNGNCLDVRDASSGRHAIFLHLDVLPKEMQPGRTIRRGQVIASSGNSGHSFAPHLHYQLEDASGRVLDPFEVQKTVRRALDAGDRPAFDGVRSKLDAQLGTLSAQR